jgi:hypothetical protein
MIGMINDENDGFENNNGCDDNDADGDNVDDKR